MYTVLKEVVFPVADLLITKLPKVLIVLNFVGQLLRQQVFLVHADDKHLLIMRAVEYAQLSALGQVLLTTPEKVVIEFLSRRLLERDNLTALRIDAAHHMADVVWLGLSTYHVRESFGDNITLEELREYWLPVSPMAYMQKLAAQPSRPQRYIYTKYDLSFPVDLSVDTMKALRRYNIPHSEVALPCGHYTLGEKPWVYLAGYKIIRFLHQHLK